MKMVLAVINQDDAPNVMQNLIQDGFSITKLSTTGGFLRAGNVTILVGADDNKTQEVIEIIKTHSQRRKQFVPPFLGNEMGFFSSMPVEVAVGGATIFVLNIEQFEKT